MIQVNTRFSNSLPLLVAKMILMANLTLSNQTDLGIGVSSSAVSPYTDTIALSAAPPSINKSEVEPSGLIEPYQMSNSADAAWNSVIILMITIGIIGNLTVIFWILFGYLYQKFSEQ